jgi:superfamily II DNA/RNA helicase
MEILRSEEFRPPIIIFVNQKRSADALARSLIKQGVSEQHNSPTMI